MSPKSDATAKLLAKIQPTWDPPTPLEGAPLLEQALLCVLVRTLSQAQAEATIKTYKQAFPDWNELRVCQPQEICTLVATKDPEKALRAARDTRDGLQEIFQWNHGYDLEFMRQDPLGAGKFVGYLVFVGHRITHYLMWLASDKKEVPISVGLVRMIDRLGITERIGPIKKARGPIDALTPKGKELELALRFGEVVDRWCHQHKPVCHQCVLVDDCVFGRKAFKEWKMQQVRLEQQRKKDEARREILRQKDEAREKKLAEREKKRVEAEQAKLEREKARRQREELRRKEHEAKEKARVAEIEKKKAAAAAAKLELERKRKQAEENKKKAAAEAAAKAKKAAQAKKPAKPKSAAKPAAKPKPKSGGSKKK